jgi:outer membrane biosynthesis protein TonB
MPMNRHLLRRSYIVLAVLFLFSFTLLSVQFGAVDVAAGKSLVVDKPIPTQPQPTKTPTEEPTKEPTIPPPPTVTPTAPPTPLPPAEIPEPITVILFGTGLAALSAAAARRKKTE